MRNDAPLTLDNPPERVVVLLPGCSRADQSCIWSAFESANRSGIDPEFVK
jgi:hypothetical protein